jgi:hypothetical protein
VDQHSDRRPDGAWLDQHADRLMQLAREAGIDPGVVHLAALLVLAGLSDAEILHELGVHHVSSDGQRDPLAGLPPTLVALRALAASDPER